MLLELLSGRLWIRAGPDRRDHPPLYLCIGIAAGTLGLPLVREAME